jgi:hypothetical protein
MRLQGAPKFVVRIEAQLVNQAVDQEFESPRSLQRDIDFLKNVAVIVCAGALMRIDVLFDPVFGEVGGSPDALNEPILPL